MRIRWKMIFIFTLALSSLCYYTYYRNVVKNGNANENNTEEISTGNASYQSYEHIDNDYQSQELEERGGESGKVENDNYSNLKIFLDRLNVNIKNINSSNYSDFLSLCVQNKSFLAKNMARLIAILNDDDEYEANNNQKAVIILVIGAVGSFEDLTFLANYRPGEQLLDIAILQALTLFKGEDIANRSYFVNGGIETRIGRVRDNPAVTDRLVESFISFSINNDDLVHIPIAIATSFMLTDDVHLTPESEFKLVKTLDLNSNIKEKIKIPLVCAFLKHVKDEVSINAIAEVIIREDGANGIPHSYKSIPEVFGQVQGNYADNLKIQIISDPQISDETKLLMLNGSLLDNVSTQYAESLVSISFSSEQSLEVREMAVKVLLTANSENLPTEAFYDKFISENNYQFQARSLKYLDAIPNTWAESILNIAHSLLLSEISDSDKIEVLKWLAMNGNSSSLYVINQFKNLETDDNLLQQAGKAILDIQQAQGSK